MSGTYTVRDSSWIKRIGKDHETPDFLKSAGAVAASFAFLKTGRLFAKGAAADGWRTFEVTTRVQVLKASGTTRIWIPAALGRRAPFQKTLANEFNAEGGQRRWSRARRTRSESSRRLDCLDPDGF